MDGRSIPEGGSLGSGHLLTMKIFSSFVQGQAQELPIGVLECMDERGVNITPPVMLPL